MICLYIDSGHNIIVIQVQIRTHVVGNLVRATEQHVFLLGGTILARPSCDAMSWLQEFGHVAHTMP